MYKKYALTFLTSLLIFGCKSNDQPENYQSYLDLRNNQDMTDRYWTIKRRVTPHFPMEAARKSLSGCVELTVGINDKGKPTGYSVNRSYPEGLFDLAATEAIGQWRWKPSSKEVEARPVFITVQLGFFLDAPRNQDEVETHCTALSKQT